jgi:hypothetical protein
MYVDICIYIYIYITAIGLSPGGSSTAHIYTKSTQDTDTGKYIIIFSGSAAQRGLWLPRSRGIVITHNDAPQSVGLLWTSDQKLNIYNNNKLGTSIEIKKN